MRRRERAGVCSRDEDFGRRNKHGHRWGIENLVTALRVTAGRVQEGIRIDGMTSIGLEVDLRSI